MLKISSLQSGGSDKQQAKLVIQLVADNTSSAEASSEVVEQLPSVWKLEMTFAGYGIFKVQLPGETQVRTGKADNRLMIVERILESCGLGEHRAEIQRRMLDFLTEHLGPLEVSPGASLAM